MLKFGQAIFEGRHHIIPRSRGGIRSKENLYPLSRWPPHSGKHRAWHILFDNLTPEEAVKSIREHVKRDGILRESFFTTRFYAKEKWSRGNQKIEIEKKVNPARFTKRKEAWKIVFGDMSGREAIEWITREFIVKEWLGKNVANSFLIPPD